jgi:hypothetical protein
MIKQPEYIGLEEARQLLTEMGVRLTLRQMQRPAEQDAYGRRKLPFFDDRRLPSSSPSILISNRSVARDLHGDRRSGRRGRWSRALVRGRSGVGARGVLGVTAEDIRVRDRADREARVAPRLADC